jgi:predicted PurR-regulated permease PerM
VVVQAPSTFWQLPALLEPLATAGLVVVLVIFMLLTYGDLRSRLVRLVGSGRLPIATPALDEAGQRISHYFLQSIINGSYGGAVGLGLFLLGVPYATLWGFLAALWAVGADEMGMPLEESRNQVAYLGQLYASSTPEPSPQATSG